MPKAISDLINDLQIIQKNVTEMTCVELSGDDDIFVSLDPEELETFDPASLGTLMKRGWRLDPARSGGQPVPDAVTPGDHVLVLMTQDGKWEVRKGTAAAIGRMGLHYRMGLYNESVINCHDNPDNVFLSRDAATAEAERRNALKIEVGDIVTYVGWQNCPVVGIHDGHAILWDRRPTALNSFCYVNAVALGDPDLKLVRKGNK